MNKFKYLYTLSVLMLLAACATDNFGPIPEATKTGVGPTDAELIGDKASTDFAEAGGSFTINGGVTGLPLADFMAEAREFIAVTDAEVWELVPGGRMVLSAPFINVSRDHIEIITPGQ